MSATEEQARALGSWPIQGRVALKPVRRGPTHEPHVWIVRGYADGGFRSRERVQRARVVAAMLRPRQLLDVLRAGIDMVYEAVHAEDTMAACPHPGTPEWTTRLADGGVMCTCGKVIRG